MILGIGCDIVKIDRINEEISKKILSSEELKIYLKIDSEKRKKEYLAGRFAAKEAIIKAFGYYIPLRDIAVLNYESGKPYVIIKEKNFVINVSISHEKEYAISYAMVESNTEV
ncbi:MAG: holo-ACP synthase [Thermotogae bacterium]|nr:holo-ACP synthase [Thermotogota bacterium]